jgi:mRNA interferase RelE/StbE
MSYKIFVRRKAQKKIESLPKSAYIAVNKKIDNLAENPRPIGYKKLKVLEGYRVKAGNYRILYDIDDGIKIVDVRKVDHRKDIYE